jgi:hypothetical protein
LDEPVAVSVTREQRLRHELIENQG